MAGSVLQFPGVALEPAPKKPKKEKGRPKNTMPDGRKRVRLDVGVDPETGKRNRIPFYGKTLTEAKAARDAYRLAHGLMPGQEWMPAPAPPAPPSPTVEAWASRWLDVYGSSAGHSTNASNGYNVDKIIAALGHMKISDVRELHIQEFANTYTDKSKSFVTKLRVTVNAVFARAVGNYLIDRNPCTGVRWDWGGEGTHRCLEDWEIAHISRHWHQHRAGLWAMIMMYAGLRRGEIIALKWSDIDLAAGVIHITSGAHFEGNATLMGGPKTDAGIRDVPIFPPLADVLQKVQLPPPTLYVCSAAQGRPMTQRAWDRAWDGFMVAMANIRNGRPAFIQGRRSDKDKYTQLDFAVRSHDLRHTFATMLYEADVDVKTAQYWLGHSDIKMTMKIYSHLRDQKRNHSTDKAAEYISNFVRGSNGVQPPQKPQ